MSNYVKATDFSVKDGLLPGNPAKIVKGTEIDDEFDAISAAIQTKADLASPTFTGSPAAPTASPGTNTTQLATTAFATTAAAAAITSANLGTISTQNANNVSITGGIVSNTTLVYNNTSTALTASNVQNAIDELCTIPAQSKSSNYTLQATDVGGHISISSGDITVPPNVFDTGDVVVIYNNASTSRNVLRGAGVTMYWYDGANANRTILQRGLASILCVSNNTFVISGQGVT
jgi:hypothetical protein